MSKFLLHAASTTLGLLLSGPLLAQAPVTIDLPLGGWRNTQGDAIRYTQTVNYPAVAVNTPSDQHRAGVISGRIAKTRKEPAARQGKTAPPQARRPSREQPPTLVVNGVSMPLLTDEEGGFSRPYAFSRGSNNVEVRAADGSASRRVQFYESYSGRQPPGLRIVLSWDSGDTDLDLHVVTADGEHAFYANRVLNNGGAIDVDVTAGYGPEIFSAPRPAPGIYHVYVNYYGGGGREGDDAGPAITTAQVAIVAGEGTPSEKQQVFRVPLRNPGELQHIRSFTYP